MPYIFQVSETGILEISWDREMLQNKNTAIISSTKVAIFEDNRRRAL